MRPPSAVVVVSLALASCSADLRQRRGLYVNGGAGPLVGGAKASTGQYGSHVAGGGVSLRVAVGYAAVDGLATAAELRAILHNGTSRFRNVESEFDVSIFGMGALLDWYPRPTGPLHLQLGLGWMSAHRSGVTAASSLNSTTAPPPVFSFSDLHGPLGHAGVGWAWRAKDGFAFTPILDVYRGRATNDEASLDVYGCALELQLTWL